MPSPTKQHELFSSRETIDEALAYSDKLIKSLPGEVQIAAYTAMWVPLNTALAQLEKASLSNVQRQSIKDIDPQGFTIASLSPEQATQHVRNVLVANLALTKDLEQILPKEGKTLTVILLLVTRMFGMPEKEVIDEMRQLLLEQLSSKLEKRG